MFGFGEWTTVFGVSGVILLLWVLAYLLCWLWQYCWSWIDDEKIGKKNILEDKCRWSKWKYPITWSKTDDDIWGWAKNKKHAGLHRGQLCERGLKDGVEYYSSPDAYKKGIDYWGMGAISILSPFLLLIGYKIYPVTIAICILILIANLARFTRRLNKKYTAHSEDKKIHNCIEEKD